MNPIWPLSTLFSGTAAVGRLHIILLKSFCLVQMTITINYYTIGRPRILIYYYRYYYYCYSTLAFDTQSHDIWHYRVCVRNATNLCTDNCRVFTDRINTLLSAHAHGATALTTNANCTSILWYDMLYALWFTRHR